MSTRNNGRTITDRPHGYKKYRAEKCRCEICCAENILIRRKYRPLKPAVLRLDGTILVDRLIHDDRLASVDTSLISRWRRQGITVWDADRWACRLGYHPIEIWGQAFYEGATSE